MNVSVAAAVALLLGAAAAVVHLEDLEHDTLVVYTTPALRDVLELHVFPPFERETGWNVEPVYLAAGAQYQRMRLSGSEPEADLFLHASPLYIERGHDEGYFMPVRAPLEGIDPAYRGRTLDAAGGTHATDADGLGRAGRAGSDGGEAVAWFAFAWSPLVEVYRAGLDAPPDLLHEEHPFGFPHPRLSNNGVYAALFYEAVSPEAGRMALAHTVVQPTNARTNVGGIADGAFEVTLGYEAVTLFYQGRGAQVRMDVPVLDGERATMPIVFSVGLVRHHDHPGAAQLAAWLLDPAVQGRLHEWGFRSVTHGHVPAGGVALGDDVRRVAVDWSDWAAIERVLSRYEVH